MEPTVSQFLSQYWQWLAMAVFSGGMLIFDLIKGRQSAVFAASPAQTIQLVNREDAVLLDVRDQAEFDAGHIQHARHIPVQSLNARLDDLERYKNQAVVVYCNSGHRALTAAKMLQTAGFEKVRILAGGLKAWETAGQPTTRKRN